MSQAHRDRHIPQQMFHMDQNQVSSKNLTQSGFDPQVNCWPEQQPLKIHQSSAVRCLCTKEVHPAGPQYLNPSAKTGPQRAANRPSEILSTLITSLISPLLTSNSSTSKMDAKTLLIKDVLPLSLHLQIDNNTITTNQKNIQLSQLKKQDNTDCRTIKLSKDYNFIDKFKERFGKKEVLEPKKAHLYFHSNKGNDKPDPCPIIF